MCACATTGQTPARLHQIADGARHDLDWDEFLRLADHHGVLPLAARNLLSHAFSLPEPVVQSLRSAYETNARRNLWFANELARIAGHFEENKVKAVPYKGPVLAESVYRDLALRNFSDLDFLIAPADFESAKQTLAQLGYQPSIPHRPEVERFWLRVGYERAFDGPAAKYLVELQWRLLPRFYAVDLETSELLERASRGEIETRSAASPPGESGVRMPRTLSPEDLLLVLCLHAAKHLWMRLLWIADIAETMRSQPIDYDVVYSRARALGALRLVGVSCWLAQHVLDATLSQSAAAIIAADPKIETLGVEFAKRLERGAAYDFESTEYFRLIMKLRERRLDRWRCFCRLLWTPGENDLATIHLPEPFFPLYHAVRLARLLRRMF